LGWWKGALVGGVYGLLASCLLLIPLQLLRLRGVDPAKFNTASVAAVLLLTGAAVRGSNSSQVYDSWAKNFPFLLRLLPVAPASNSVNDEANRKLATFHSAAFVCSVQMPGPLYLQRKQIAKMSTTILTHQSEDGALVMSYSKMLSPEEMLQEQRARNPFSIGPASVPGPVYFDVEKGLDGAAKGSVDEMHGKASYTMRVNCGPFPGREVAGSIAEHDGAFKERLFIGNGNLYAIMSVGKSNWVNSKRSERFLDSFQIK
jgi:hypothetical protein